MHLKILVFEAERLAIYYERQLAPIRLGLGYRLEQGKKSLLGLMGVRGR